MNIGNQLEKECQEAGVSVQQVLRRADVNPSIISRWKKNQPKTFSIADKIRESIRLCQTEKDKE